MRDRDSKHWPRRALRRAYLLVLPASAATLFVSGLAHPSGWFWH
jgi:hypothetical protein